MLRTVAIVLVLATASTANAAALPELRGQVGASSARVQGVRSQRLELEKTLGEVAARIERIKADRQGRGALFGDAELDGLLKRSQELSAKLTELLRSERDAEEALRSSQSGLVAEIDRELARLRAQWDAGASRDVRQNLVPKMKALRSERDSLRRELPAALVPALGARPSDDPEELLERADALLDSEDKLRREERALAERIRALQEERELERRMHDFLGQEALFDEHDRRISASRRSPAAASDTVSESAPAPNDKGGQPPAADPTRNTDPNSSFDGTQSTSGPSVGSAMPGPSTPPTPGRQDSPGPAVDVVRSGVSRMPPERRGNFSPWSDDETVEELEARRAQIRALADALHREAEESSRKARDLH